MRYYSSIYYNWHISIDVYILCIKYQFSDWNTLSEYHLMHSNALPRKGTTLSVKKKSGEKWPIF